MTKGLARSLSRGAVLAPIVKQTIPIRAAAVSVVGATGVGFGTVVIGDFPAGNILFLGAVSYVQLTSVDADITVSYDGDYSIGTTPNADVTLSGTEIDIIQSTALGVATGKLSPVARGTSAIANSGQILDNTDGSLELNLNVLIDDANISGTADMTASGFVVVSYIVLGDD